MSYCPRNPHGKAGNEERRKEKKNNFTDMPDSQTDQIKHALAQDHEATALLKVINNGWPRMKSQLLAIVRPYFHIRDTLTTHEGLIFKGERLWIHNELRNEMKTRLHLSHPGYDSMVRRARDSIFWLGMNSEIKQLANNCLTCQRHQPKNRCYSTLKARIHGRKSA